MAIFDSCCYKWSTKTGSIVIGSLLLVFSVCFLIVTIGLVAAWEDFDTQFLDDRLSRYNTTASEKLRSTLAKIQAFQEEIRPVWKKSFISLYCFLPWYALANILLIIGAKKEIKVLLWVWILFTLGFIIWSFTLVSVMFGYDTTPNFVAGVAVAQIANFAICACFVLVVVSLFQDLQCKTIKGIFGGQRAEEYINNDDTA